MLEKYYQMLLTTSAVPRLCKKKHSGAEQYVTPATIRSIHSLMRSALSQAEKWDLIRSNPARYAMVPVCESKALEIWDASTLFKTMECCEDRRLKLCMNLAFACSLRIGELLGSTWDCVDISEESILAGNASISITKELQRVGKEAMEALASKDVIVSFPEQGLHNKRCWF